MCRGSAGPGQRRKKEVIINAADKNMSPSNIEGAVLAASMLIAQVVAVGDRRPYIVALIALDPEAAAAFAAQNGQPHGRRCREMFPIYYAALHV
jgi:long-chain acyl-CoA synthetase